jgi:hypothetical protein
MKTVTVLEEDAKFWTLIGNVDALVKNPIGHGAKVTVFATPEVIASATTPAFKAGSENLDLFASAVRLDESTYKDT